MNSMLIDNSKINQIVYITKNKIVFIDKTEQKINIKIDISNFFGHIFLYLNILKALLRF